MTNLQHAKQIAEEYDLTLPKRWTGHKNVEHAWHHPYIYWPMTYAQYLDRIVEIRTNKPEGERVGRFALMKVSDWQPKSKEYTLLVKAGAAWEKADAAEINEAHERECPNCRWHGTRLPQFD